MPTLLPPLLLLLLRPTHEALPNSRTSLTEIALFLSIATAVRVTHNLDKTDDIIAFKFVLL
jgi:hypothetical protein